MPGNKEKGFAPKRNKAGGKILFLISGVKRSFGLRGRGILFLLDLQQGKG